MVLSKYTKEGDIEEDTSSLITRENTTKKIEAAKKVLEMSSGIVNEAVENLKDLIVEDPKDVVAIKQAEDKEQVKKLSQDLQGMDAAESS